MPEENSCLLEEFFFPALANKTLGIISICFLWDSLLKILYKLSEKKALNTNRSCLVRNRGGEYLHMGRAARENDFEFVNKLKRPRQDRLRAGKMKSRLDAAFS